MQTSKYKINDHVKVVNGWYKNLTGNIDRMKKNGDRYFYHVTFYKDGRSIGDCTYRACDLVKVEAAKNKPIQIVEFRPQDIVQHAEPVRRKRTPEIDRTMKVLENKDYLDCRTPQEYLRRLKSNYEEVCKRYLIEFCHKHHLKIDPYTWVGDEIGGTANIEDLYVSFADIRYDVDNSIPEPDFQKWYDKSLEIYELTGEHYMNYPSYCKGAPDNWSEERLQKIRESKNRIFALQRELDDEIKRYIADSTKSKPHPTNPMVGHF